jgi:mannose-6-phosphate isomerase
MSTVLPGMLRFEEAYQPRPWGGQRLATALGKPAPADTPIGEAWLVSDHPSHVSRVAEGPWAGHTLHQILKAVPDALLGTLAKPTPHGRFPLLLKLLDAAEPLSVQVHPDDHHALRLGEPDVGKTEMWYVLDADPQSCLYCGLHADTTPEQLTQSIHNSGLVEHLMSYPANPGASVFVPAGTIHAIGAGILIAEIQQNSDLTYRLYDWGRTDAQGRPRELHVEKSLAVTKFGQAPAVGTGLRYTAHGIEHTVLGACPYFAGERLESSGGEAHRETGGRSFHLLLGVHGTLHIGCDGETQTLQPGQALLIPGNTTEFTITGTGTLLDYYVPDLTHDIAAPLQTAGHANNLIERLLAR